MSFYRHQGNSLIIIVQTLCTECLCIVSGVDTETQIAFLIQPRLVSSFNKLICLESVSHRDHSDLNMESSRPRILVCATGEGDCKRHLQPREYFVLAQTVFHGVCPPGSVATIKLPELVSLLTQFADVKVVCTTAGRHFLQEDQLPEAARPILGVSQACVQSQGLLPTPRTAVTQWCSVMIRWHVPACWVKLTQMHVQWRNSLCPTHALSFKTEIVFSRAEVPLTDVCFRLQHHVYHETV